MTITRKQLSAHLKKYSSSIEEFEAEVEKQGLRVDYSGTCKYAIDVSLSWRQTSQGSDYWRNVANGRKPLVPQGAVCDYYSVFTRE